MSVGTGALTEDIACKWLSKQKLKIHERNFHSRFGEIDIIADDHGTLCFIEVRYRKNQQFGNAAETVTASKQKKILTTANHYLMSHSKYSHAPCRFDIIAMHGDKDNPEIDWLKNAFMIGDN